VPRSSHPVSDEEVRPCTVHEVRVDFRFQKSFFFFLDGFQKS
jgi:hypothetical protein